MQPTEHVPVMAFPGALPVVERQPEQCQNRVVNTVLIDIHSNRERQQRGLRQASLQQMAYEIRGCFGPVAIVTFSNQRRPCADTGSLLDYELR